MDLQSIAEAVVSWWSAPGAWWQFWLPGSGFGGGLISGTIFSAAFLTIFLTVRQ